jgi:chromosome segregation ATPase
MTDATQILMVLKKAGTHKLTH